MFKRKPSKASIETLIGPRTRINGDVEFSGGLHVDGQINGNVTTDLESSAVVSVSERGCIEGSVAAPTVLLNGIVKGNIDASGRVELGAKARVHGNVHYSVLETAVGAQINGKLIHRAASDPAADTAAQNAAGTAPGRAPAAPVPSGPGREPKA